MLHDLLRNLPDDPGGSFGRCSLHLALATSLQSELEPPPMSRVANAVTADTRREISELINPAVSRPPIDT